MVKSTEIVEIARKFKVVILILIMHSLSNKKINPYLSANHGLLVSKFHHIFSFFLAQKLYSFLASVDCKRNCSQTVFSFCIFEVQIDHIQHWKCPKNENRFLAISCIRQLDFGLQNCWTFELMSTIAACAFKTWKYFVIQ